MSTEQPEPELGLLRRRTTGKLEGAFDAWQFKIRLNQDVSSHIVKQLQKECGTDLVRAIDRFHEMEMAQRRDSLTGIIEVQPEKDPSKHIDPKGRKDIIVRDQYWDRSKRQWVLKKVQPGTSKKYNRCVLFVRRVYTEKMIYDETLLVVKGPILRNALRNIFRGARGFGLTVEEESEVKAPFLFWALPELQLLADHYRRRNDDLALFEINAALKFIEQEYSVSTLTEIMAEAAGQVTFDKLWTIFAPDCLIVGKDSFDAMSVWRARSHGIKKLRDGSIIFEIAGEYLEWDGKKLGNVYQPLVIPRFEGAVKIEDLAFSPLKRHPQEKAIKERILKRSERKTRFCKLGYEIQEYEGVGLVEVREKIVEEETVREKIVRYRFQGRIIIDPAMMAKVEPNNKLNPSTTRLRRLGRVCISDLMAADHVKGVLDELLKDFNEASAEIDDSFSDTDSNRYDSGDDVDIPRDGIEETGVPQRGFSTEEKLLLSSYLCGYSLKNAKWGAFSVDRVSDIKWESSIFDSLVMDAKLKETIYQLIQAQSSGLSKFDDFVRGKGRGLIGLLFGPPGTGKTLTAEAIAETAEMPLYAVSSGSLGHEAEDIYDNLSNILRLATHWRAVLLLDEADVFLAKRTTMDLKRNAIVSVFLRELEYYQGILLLTTNKASIIDEAFQSRIHFCHRYPSIDFDSRRQIWMTFMDKARESEGIVIKNVMSMAIKLALTGDHVLTAESIIGTVNLLQNFNFSNDEDEPWKQTNLPAALSSFQARDTAPRAKNNQLAIQFDQSGSHSQTASQDLARKAPRPQAETEQQDETNMAEKGALFDITVDELCTGAAAGCRLFSWIMGDELDLPGGNPWPRSKRSGVMPARLIEIAITSGTTSLRPRQTDEIGRVRFAALSYCWGSEQPMKCLGSDIVSYRTVIPLNEQPLTIKDAVKVCWEIGIQYLWIDALCIIQDDSNDKSIKIAKMTSIYGSTTVTIAAARLSSAAEGFLGERFPGSRDGAIVPYRCINGELGSIVLVQRNDGRSPEEPIAPINERGWTLKERLLSSRIIESSGISLGGFTDGWRRHVSFSSKRMTEALDLEDIRATKSTIDFYGRPRNSQFTLAISGMAQIFAELSGDQYIAGLWKLCSHSGLLWGIEHRYANPENIPLPPTYQGFSWSWLSVNGPVKFSQVQRPSECVAEILSCEAVPANETAPCGLIYEGSG
ncbi:hypothetical protein GQX73_g7873 [Xylaria multiplex]|uniref:AAA+ ATPase domain-containing protein n=1 Tax=Xylaria multiplex TaxID=323545 RepID=A0A7C8MQA0_9PEZI|nr:hypothetical protein GQX73_g7873 [Xylaria multiplex]